MSRTHFAALLSVLFIPAALSLHAMTTSKVLAQDSYGQPSDERAAQERLPQAEDPLWVRLEQCKVEYDQKTDVLSIDVLPDVKALDGKAIVISGFILPLDGDDKTKHFLLTKRSPVCSYCPPGGPNEAIEVRSKKALDWTSSIVKLEGTFKLVNDSEREVFFQLLAAEPVN
jgi:hypothetical protein